MRLAANISTMFTEHPLIDRFAAAADAGFRAVEIQFPYEVPAGRLAASRLATGVEVVLINMPAGELNAGDLGLAGVPGRGHAFLDTLPQALDYAAALSCSRVNCLAGNQPSDASEADCWPLLIDNVGRATAEFASQGIGLLVEAMNRKDRPTFLLNDLAKAERLMEAVDHPNLALQYDLYHEAANGGHWRESLPARLERIGHIQISDCPGRGPPGSGSIDFSGFFDVLSGLPYKGWIGCEYAPAGPTLDSLGWLSMVGLPAGSVA